jgi:hypothetical protein
MRTAAAVALSVLALGSCGGAGQTCPLLCPAPSWGATVVVRTTPDMAVDGVQAVLAGPVTGTMACQPNFSAILCEWPPGVYVVAGTYSLEVSAPGYQTATIQVEVATPPPGTCGCSEDSIQPSTVTINSADGWLG